MLWSKILSIYYFVRLCNFIYMFTKKTRYSKSATINKQIFLNVQYFYSLKWYILWYPFKYEILLTKIKDFHFTLPIHYRFESAAQKYELCCTTLNVDIFLSAAIDLKTIIFPYISNSVLYFKYFYVFIYKMLSILTVIIT